MRHDFRVVYNAYHQSHIKINKIVILAGVAVKVDTIEMIRIISVDIHMTHEFEILFYDLTSGHLHTYVFYTLSTRIVDTVCIHCNVRHYTHVIHDF